MMELNKMYLGNSLEILCTFPDNSIDSVVTDPPYGISFMAKGWDTFAGNKQYADWCEQWARECLRVLKPGGHLLAFSGTRTYHALAWGVESAGFEIRDMIEWLYLSGFPKSMDISKQFNKIAGAEREKIGEYEYKRKGEGTWDQEVQGGMFKAQNRIVDITAPATPLVKQWDGWGTALKPAHEPIVMARKPLEGTVCANVEKYGTGAINVDGCRIPYVDDNDKKGALVGFKEGQIQNTTVNFLASPLKKAKTIDELPDGRFPANCITLDDDQWYSKYFNVSPREVSKKASNKDRNSDWRGREIDLPVLQAGALAGRADGSLGSITYNRNTHPTVKPTDLMAWLVRLVTPPGGTVLDPFAGSGSTLVAAKREGFNYIGIELIPEYAEIAKRRIADESCEKKTDTSAEAA